LFEDINSLLLQYHKGSSYQLPLKTSSFKEWITQQYKYADSPEFLKEKEYWRQLESTAVPPFQREWEGDGRAIFDAEEVVLSTESTAALLRMVNVAFEADMNDLLLTAIGMALKSITGNNKILLALEGHGREDISSDIDVSRTVGWFTSMYPVVLDIENEQEPLVQLQAIKTSLRKIPKKGIGHGILKYLTSKEKKADLQFLLQPRIGFNYLGQFDTDINNLSLRIAAEPVGKLKSDQHNGKHDLEIKALLTGNKLHLSASYCVNHFREETITRMLDHCVHSLENIIAAANSYNGVSPLSGFAYKELSVQDLESLFD
jgi:non-ribosomal peptide synthase protein (TIGR01720 family)